eukprot:scaffold76_cov118-Isochrysis_galbana.AAC.3
MDMVPGPEVVRTLSFVDQEALVGAARVGNPTVGQGATCGAEGQSAGPQSSPRHELQQAMAALKPPTPTKPSHREPCPIFSSRVRCGFAFHESPSPPLLVALSPCAPRAV